jgi:hypothetical protein
MSLRLATWISALLAACGGGNGARSADAPLPHDATGDTAAADATPGDATAAGSACPAGSTLLVDRTSCPGAVVAPPAALLASTAQPGDVVSLDGLDEGSLPCLPAYVCRPADAATMMFSDDPESPSTDGVLYADTLGPGHVRLYVYHVNAGASPRKFPVVVLNQGGSDAHLTITQEGLGGPSTDYVDVGKSVAAAWMSSSLATAVTVPASTRVLLDATLDGEHAATNELVHAIIDVDADAPVKISIVSVLATEDAAAVTASLPLLPNDGLHDRGTFAGADVWITGSAGGEGSSARNVRLGGDVTEADLTGTDATTGSAATLLGNYGVAYRFAITSPSAIRFAASARGGAWAGALGGSAVVPLPTATGALSTTTDAVWLATLGAGSASFALMSGGGSSLPVDIVVLTP